eukprot:GHVQ01030582.1.p1 GENE.GHVQ01030582.1~~GHVQ01030582.1.p1  ORF type:complete len:456 (+),score=44.55 GHVQ01030582.1:3-1370(+)
MNQHTSIAPLARGTRDRNCVDLRSPAVVTLNAIMSRTFSFRNVFGMCSVVAVVLALVVPCVTADSNLGLERFSRFGMTPRDMMTMPLLEDLAAGRMLSDREQQIVAFDRRFHELQQLMGLELAVAENKLGLESTSTPATEKFDHFARNLPLCDHDVYFTANWNECESLHERLVKIMEMFEEEHLVPALFRQSTFFMWIRNHMQLNRARCCDEDYIVINPRFCQLVQGLAVRVTDSCTASPLYFKQHEMLCEDSRRGLLSFVAIRCQGTDYRSEREDECRENELALRSQLDKCQSNAYYWLHQQACEDQKLFMIRHIGKEFEHVSLGDVEIEGDLSMIPSNMGQSLADVFRFGAACEYSKFFLAHQEDCERMGTAWHAATEMCDERDALTSKLYDSSFRQLPLCFAYRAAVANTGRLLLDNEYTNEHSAYSAAMHLWIAEAERKCNTIPRSVGNYG